MKYLREILLTNICDMPVCVEGGQSVVTVREIESIWRRNTNWQRRELKVESINDEGGKM